MPQLAASVQDPASGRAFEVLHVPATQTFPVPQVDSLLLLVQPVFAAQQSHVYAPGRAASQLAELVHAVATTGNGLEVLQVPASHTLPAPQSESVVPQVVFAAQQLHA